MQTKTITKLLALPNFEVVKVLEHQNPTLHLYIDLIDPVAPVCSACAAVHPGLVHSIGWIRGRLAPLRQTGFSLCAQT